MSETAPNSDLNLEVPDDATQSSRVPSDLLTRRMAISVMLRVGQVCGVALAEESESPGDALQAILTTATTVRAALDALGVTDAEIEDVVHELLAEDQDDEADSDE